MARQPRTPGATEPKAEEKTTAQQADAVLDEILGTSSEDQSTSKTGVVSELDATEPTNAELLAQVKALQEQLNEQSKPTTQHVATSDAPTPKRTRQVLGPNGWITEEY